MLANSQQVGGAWPGERSSELHIQVGRHARKGFVKKKKIGTNLGDHAKAMRVGNKPF